MKNRVNNVSACLYIFMATLCINCQAGETKGSLDIGGKNIFGSPSKIEPVFSDKDLSIEDDGENVVISIRTQKPKQNAAAFLDLNNQLDIKNAAIRFRVWSESWKDLEEFSIILESDESYFGKTFTLDAAVRLQNPVDRQWIEIIAPINDWEKFNNPNPRHISALMWKVRDAGRNRVSVKVDHFQLIQGGPNPMISISFDDGLISDLVGMKLMDEEGFRGSLNIDETVLGTKGYLSQAQINRFDEDGWDVSGHQVLHNFRAATNEQLDAYIKATANYLRSKNYRGSNIYAYPNGIDDDRINSVIFRYFEYGLNINSMSNLSSFIDPKRINRRAVDRFTSLSQIGGWIKDAKINNTWLILVFHSFVEDSVENENITPAFFAQILRIIKESQIPVVPISKVLQSIKTLPN